MSNEANRSLVLAYYRRVVGDGQLAEIPNYIGSTYVDHNAPPGSIVGPALVELHLQAIRKTFPDFVLNTHEVVADQDWVAVRVTGEGTHLGEWLGIEPTGKRIRLRGINLDRVHAGRIVEHWGEADTVGMLMQMGVDPFGQLAGV
jgi:predicted SnoaL-like aldol condensation-catalyzing enzyme